MIAKQHQIEKAQEAFEIFNNLGYVYIAGLPRTGKTLTAILVAEKIEKPMNVLVFTQKEAIKGWTKFITHNLKHNYKVTNYEQAPKLQHEYDLVIIDESHNIGGIGKPSKRWHNIVKLSKELPHIHLSGTAIVETIGSIYYQMCISKYRPFNHHTFYDFFREYGKPYVMELHGRTIAKYDRYRTDYLMAKINKFTVYITQDDAGIVQEDKSIDKLHYVELHDELRDIYNTFRTKRLLRIPITKENVLIGDKYDGELIILGDTPMKLVKGLHQIESGCIKVEERYIDLGIHTKIKYILDTFGDTEEVGIMADFIAEREVLKKYFKRASILSAHASAEGTDLTHLTHFIILSHNYSGAKHIQRRERIVNMSGSNTNIVNFILVKNAISDQVYKRVSKKLDFNYATYESKAI